MKDNIYKIRYKFCNDSCPAGKWTPLEILNCELIPHEPYSGYQQYCIEKNGYRTDYLVPDDIGVIDNPHYMTYIDIYLYDYKKFTENGTNSLSDNILISIRNSKLVNLLN